MGSTKKWLRITLSSLSVMAVIVLGGGLKQAEAIPVITVPAELSSFNLTGSADIPLASDPSNSLGGSINGFGFVRSNVRIKNSTIPTLGSAVISPRAGNDTSFPAIRDGDQLDVVIAYDAYFDIILEDDDDEPGRDFAGEEDGETIVYQGNGPMSFETTCIVDLSKPYFGCLPPEGVIDIGSVNFVIPLHMDINGNGEEDILKLTGGLMDISLQDVHFVNDSMIHSMDVSLTVDGNIMDASTDPPFTLPLTGPANGRLTMIPEPSTMLLLGAGLLGLAAFIRKIRK